MSHKSSKQLIRNTYNFQRASQKQVSPITIHERGLIQPFTMNAARKFSQNILLLQSKIEGVENLVKKKSNVSENQNKIQQKVTDDSDVSCQEKQGYLLNQSVKIQQAKQSSKSILETYDFSPIRKSHRYYEPNKYNEQSPIKKQINLHSSSSNYVHVPQPQKTAPLTLKHKSGLTRSFIDKAAQNESDNSFSIKLNNSFFSLITEPDAERSIEARLNNSNYDNETNKREMNNKTNLNLIKMKNALNILKVKNIQKQIKKRKTNVIQGFQFGKNLGKGKFGEVYLAQHIETGFLVAIKKVNKQKLKEYRMIDQFVQQIKLHKSLDHPTIVKFYCYFQQKDDIYLVIQYMNGGTLFDYLNDMGVVALKQAVDFLKDIIEALVYLHERSIVHRDIKPQNIVISSTGIAKLCDFGWSAVVDTLRTTFCGTLDYASPQIIERKKYNHTVDVWSIGILTYQLFVGRAPFQGSDRKQVMQKIVNVDKQAIPMIESIPKQAKEFILALLQKDPASRPKITELLNFPLFTQNLPKGRKEKER